MPKILEELKPDELTHLQALLQRAEQGDVACLNDLRQTLDQIPVVWQRYGDLGRQALTTWRQVIAGSNLLLQESLQRKQEELRNELSGGPDCPPLELLLIDHLLCCWLQVWHVDALKAQGKPPVTLYTLEGRQRNAQHRFLRSIQALATLRKLLKVVPSPVQIASRLNTKSSKPFERHASGLPVGVTAN